MASTAKLSVGRRSGFPAAACLLVLLLPTQLAAQRPAPAEVQRDPASGLATVRLATREGAVVVYLPDDLAAGDTLSGTVSLEPAGRTPDERRKNLSTLNGYVVEVGKEQAPAGEGRRTLILPPAARSLGIRLLWRAAPVGEGSLPISPTSGAPPAEIRTPTFSQTGRPLPITGAFDGRFETSAVTIGDREAQLLAESPRRLVVAPPLDVVGPTTIRVREAGSTATAPYRRVAVELRADRLDLKRGERTTLQVNVRGLEGLDQSLEVRLTNRSPQVVTMSGGNQQLLAITPAQVGEDGVARFPGTLTSVGTGGFEISADLLAPATTTTEEGRPAGEPPVESAPLSDRPVSGPGVVFQQAPSCECERVDVALLEKGLTSEVTFSADRTRADVKVTMPFKADLRCGGAPEGACSATLTPRFEPPLWWHTSKNHAVPPAEVERAESGSRQESIRVSREKKPGEKAAPMLPLLSLSDRCDKDQSAETWSLVYQATLLPKGDASGFDDQAKIVGTLRAHLEVGNECPAPETPPGVSTVQIDGKSDGISLLLSDLDGDRRIRGAGSPSAEPELPDPCVCQRVTLRLKDGATAQLLPSGADASPREPGTADSKPQKPEEARSEGSSSRILIRTPFTYQLECSGEGKSCTARIQVLERILSTLENPWEQEVWTGRAQGKAEKTWVRTSPLLHTSTLWGTLPLFCTDSGSCGSDFPDTKKSAPKDGEVVHSFHILGQPPFRGRVRYSLVPNGDCPGEALEIEVAVSLTSPGVTVAATAKVAAR